MPPNPDNGFTSCFANYISLCFQFPDDTKVNEAIVKMRDIDPKKAEKILQFFYKDEGGLKKLKKLTSPYNIQFFSNLSSAYGRTRSATLFGPEAESFCKEYGLLTPAEFLKKS